MSRLYHIEIQYEHGHFGLSQAHKRDGLRANSLWPKTTVATAAVKHMLPKPVYMASRHARIMADAAHFIFTNNDKSIPVTSI